MGVLSKVLTFAFALARVWLILGFLLRITGLRDFISLVQLPYFTTPWLVQAVGFAMLVWWDGCRKALRLLLVQTVLAAVALMGWIITSWRWAPATQAKPELRLVAWNVARPEKRLSYTTNYLQKQNADIIAIAEWQPERGGSIEQWKRAFPRYQAQSLPGNMLLLTRGQITAEGTGLLHRSSFYGLNLVQLGKQQALVLQADLYAGPFANRGPGVKALTDLMAKQKGRPLILVGDLNTPRESRRFDPMRKVYRHAFEAAGRGYGETWPLPLPVLGLDQVWVSDAFEVVRCEHGFTPWSDHRPVIVDLRWKTSAQPAAGR